MKPILVAFVAALALASCGNTSGNACQPNAGYCRHVRDGACQFLNPVCCEGSAPHCGDGAQLVPMDSEGCTVVAELTTGIGCL